MIMKENVDLSLSSRKDGPQAVVIGCSHDNQNCNHAIHPSREDFYTIDIDERIKPDLRLDITQGQAPENLQNKFKLTILECLPFYAYNHDDLMMQMTGQRGQNGWDNIRKITDENGFIMIVGNSTDFRFRSSLAGLNYLEIAEYKGKPDIILIPNNQNLSVEEVKQHLDALPIPLKKSIEEATTSQRMVSPLEPTEFCKLNYKVSDVNKELITDLSTYISARSMGKEYNTTLEFLGFKLNFGYSQDDKINAADAMIQVLLGNQPPNSLIPHQEALANGTLGLLVKDHLNGRSLQSLIHPPQQEGDMQQENQAQIAYGENLRRLKLIDKFAKKSCSEEEEEPTAENTFISYADLQALAKNGEKFFIPPTSKDEGCLSCGDGRLYRGSLKEIYNQLQLELKAHPENEKTLTGLARINQEILAFPNKVSPPNDSPSEEPAKVKTSPTNSFKL